MIKLRQFEDKDIDTFRKWLYLPHVAKWYHEPEDWMDEVKQRKDKYSFVNHFIVEYDIKPIGFCQYYEYIKGGETWHGDIATDGTYSIDYLIGESEYLGRKLGTKIINALCELIKKHDNVKRIIVQPESENKASCGVLLSCGFKYDESNALFIKEI